MQYCKNCGKKLEKEKFCSNCGNPVDESFQAAEKYQNINSNANGSSLEKDNLGIAGFICGLSGFLCCTYVSIPGLICSIMSINNIKKGKVEPNNKWMGIVGLIFSILGIGVMIINIIEMINGTNTIYNLMSNN